MDRMLGTLRGEGKKAAGEVGAQPWGYGRGRREDPP